MGPATTAGRETPTRGCARRSALGAGVLLLLLLPMGSGSAVSAQDGSLGPLRTSGQNPLYRLFYVPEAEPADVVDPGRIRVDLSTSYSNVFEKSSSDVHAQLFDLEQMTTGLTLRYGVTSALEVGGRLGFHTGWGGFLDPIVSGFHKTFGLPNGGRDSRPSNDYRVLLEAEDPRVSLELPSRTFALEDARLFAKWRVLGEAAGPAVLSVRGTVRRSSGPLEPGRLAGAVALLGRVTADRVVLHLGAGGTTLDAPEKLRPIASTSAPFFTFAIEGPIRPGFSFVGQLVGSGPYVSGFDDGELDRFPLNLVLGFSGRTDGEWAWEVSFAEDFPPGSPSVDFTVDLQVARTF